MTVELLTEGISSSIVAGSSVITELSASGNKETFSISPKTGSIFFSRKSELNTL